MKYIIIFTLLIIFISSKIVNIFRLYIFFINSFGFYRNIYRTFIEVYFILELLDSFDYIRRVNIFSIIFSPYNSSLNEILTYLISLYDLNKGIKLDLP